MSETTTTATKRTRRREARAGDFYDAWSDAASEYAIGTSRVIGDLIADVTETVWTPRSSRFWGRGDSFYSRERVSDERGEREHRSEYREADRNMREAREELEDRGWDLRDAVMNAVRNYAEVWETSARRFRERYDRSRRVETTVEVKREETGPATDR